MREPGDRQDQVGRLQTLGTLRLIELIVKVLIELMELTLKGVTRWKNV